MGYFDQLSEVEASISSPKQRQADKIKKTQEAYKSADKKAKFAKSKAGMVLNTITGLPSAAGKMVGGAMRLAGFKKRK